MEVRISCLSFTADFDVCCVAERLIMLLQKVFSQMGAMSSILLTIGSAANRKIQEHWCPGFGLPVYFSYSKIMMPRSLDWFFGIVQSSVHLHSQLQSVVISTNTSYLSLTSPNHSLLFPQGTYTDLPTLLHSHTNSLLSNPSLFAHLRVLRPRLCVRARSAFLWERREVILVGKRGIEGNESEKGL